MHSTYHTQVQSFSARTSYYSNGRCPSSCFCCCSCPLSPNCSRLTVPTNPTIFYGLRQSTLIHLAPSRRLIYHRTPICNVGQHCFGESCCVEQQRVDRFVKRGVCKEDCCVKRRARIGSVSESRSRMMGKPRGSYRCSSVLGDAEAMLSLLTEEVSEECLDVRGRKGRLVREGKVVQMDYDVDEKSEDCKENVGLDCGMKGHLRRRESSSSCHMVSDSVEFESDRENEMSQGEFDGEFSVKKEKDLRKTGGVVIREEGRQNSDVYRDQQLKSSTYDDLRVGNSSKKEWDCRKKSEKKLTEQSAETESSKVSVKRRFQLSRVHESNSAKGSNSKKRLSYEKGESSSGVSSHVQSNTCIGTDNRASEYLKSSNTHQQLVENRNEVESTSGRHSTYNEEENVMVVAELAQETGCKYCEECGGITQISDTQSDSQQHDEVLVVRSQSQSRVMGQEHSSTSLQSSVTEASKVENRSESRFEMQEKSSSLRREESKEHQMTHASAEEVIMEKKSHHYAESSSTSRKQSETRVKNSEEFTTSFVSKQEMKGLQQKESSCKVTKEVESKEESQTRLLASQVNSTNVEISNQSLSDQRIYSEQTHSRAEVKSMENIREKHGQINETNVQVGVQTKKQGRVVQTGFSGHSSGDSTVTQASITLVSQTGFEQADEGEIRSGLQVSIVSPYDEPSGSSVSIDHERITETGTSVAFVQPEPRSNLDSLQIVGEFDEKTSHEVSSSDTKMEKKLSPRNSKRQDEKHLLKGSSLSDKISLLKEDTRDSSERLFGGTKKSSDEMLGVKNHLPQESSEKELSVSKPSENFDAKRTGKSLWSIIARIFRWGSQSEMQTSTVKPGDPLSSESVTTSSKNDTEKQQTSLPQKPTTSDRTQLDRNATRNQQVNLGVIGSVDSTGYVGLGASSSSSVLQSGLLLGVISIEANTESNITQKKPQSDPSLNLSINPSRQTKRSNTSEEIQEVSQIEGSASSVEEHKQHQVDVGQTGVEPKQGKLQRSDQVLQEMFDKWENAYKLESEQRKIDEFFMREALLEARNAADSWEVPIGAVLVQNGKIIARGYNLVEELRDATAHAEIICIREGSSVLRTWRLSETTLYVTLEPCPMCAGAILQARIGTLVWGAPNKLLGADGSWIRLLPEGAEGEERPEVSDKPAAPVHPFHPKMAIRRGVLQSECAEIMQQFFQLRRKKNKQENKAENPNQSSRLPISHHPSKFLHKMHDFLQIMLCIKF